MSRPQPRASASDAQRASADDNVVRALALAEQVWANVMEYRVPVTSCLLVVCLASMFVLTSQSASSLPTYLLALVVLTGLRRWSGLWESGVFLAAVGVATYLAASSFWSSPFDARGALSQFSRALLILSFVVAVAEGFRVDWFLGRMTATVTIVAGAAACAALAVFIAAPPMDGRLTGLGQLDAIVPAALVFGVCLLFALSCAFVSHGPLRYLAIGAAGVMVIAVALSGSRNAWVSVGFGVFVLLAGRLAPRRSWFAVIVAVVTLVGLGTLVALWAGQLQGLHGVLLPRGDSLRLAIWGNTLDRVWTDCLWFGCGVLTDDTTVADGFTIPHPHNLYLTVLFQGGIIGLGALLGLIVLSLRALVRHYEAEEAKLALAMYAIALPAYLLDGHELVDKIGWTWMLVWLPVAISIGLANARHLADARRFSGG